VFDSLGQRLNGTEAKAFFRGYSPRRLHEQLSYREQCEELATAMGVTPRIVARDTRPSWHNRRRRIVRPAPQRGSERDRPFPRRCPRCGNLLL
jgi:hypothetical protein